MKSTTTGAPLPQGQQQQAPTQHGAGGAQYARNGGHSIPANNTNTSPYAYQTQQLPQPTTQQQQQAPLHQQQQQQGSPYQPQEFQLSQGQCVTASHNMIEFMEFDEELQAHTCNLSTTSEDVWNVLRATYERPRLEDEKEQPQPQPQQHGQQNQPPPLQAPAQQHDPNFAFMHQHQQPLPLHVPMTPSSPPQPQQPRFPHFQPPQQQASPFGAAPVVGPPFQPQASQPYLVVQHGNMYYLQPFQGFLPPQPSPFPQQQQQQQQGMQAPPGVVLGHPGQPQSMQQQPQMQQQQQNLHPSVTFLPTTAGVLGSVPLPQSPPPPPSANNNPSSAQPSMGPPPVGATGTDDKKARRRVFIGQLPTVPPSGPRTGSGKTGATGSASSSSSKKQKLGKTNEDIAQKMMLILCHYIRATIIPESDVWFADPLFKGAGCMRPQVAIYMFPVFTEILVWRVAITKHWYSDRVLTVFQRTRTEDEIAELKKNHQVILMQDQDPNWFRTGVVRQGGGGGGGNLPPSATTAGGGGAVTGHNPQSYLSSRRIVPTTPAPGGGGANIPPVATETGTRQRTTMSQSDSFSPLVTDNSVVDDDENDNEHR